MTDENKTKIWKQLKLYLGAELTTVYSMYGYKDLASRVADEFMEAMVVTHKRLNGEKIPLTKQAVLGRLRERRRKK